jgi:predicted dehydrogenase/threonine dehydrogenase-like Zn-dependent dehydrogenase
MKQVLQDLGSGKTSVIEVPAPVCRSGNVLIASSASLISAGTERMLVEFGNASLLKKALKQPDRVRDVIDKIGTDGLVATAKTVRSKLAQPIPLGYSNIGRVVETGAGVSGLKPGDRVVSNGPHAEVVRSPINLCARVPEGVNDETAAFTVVASIGLQAVRLAQPTLGEAFVVIGAGLIGLLTIQILLAHGCRVLAVDLDANKLAIAAAQGAETCNPAKGADPVSVGLAFSRGEGVDGVIITASTPSSEPISQAARMSRKRGRIIMAGVTGMELKRAEFYEKELSFQVSCSYGPGRYDPAYETAGQDYPFGFVRWTEKRNFEAVLDLMSAGKIKVEALITGRFDISEAGKAYASLSGDRNALGQLLTYPDSASKAGIRSVVLKAQAAPDATRPVLSFIGAGNYASRVLIPAFKQANAQFRLIAASTGLGAAIHGTPAGFAEAVSDAQQVLQDKATTAIAVATRHDSHASLAAQALDSGKHAFIEKPLALDLESLQIVKNAYERSAKAGNGRQLMVGFNRRFAPHVAKAKNLLMAVSSPKSMILTMNAGHIPAAHWTQNASDGGGRIIGEACHMIDLARFLAGSPIISVSARAMASHKSEGVPDTATISLGFADGSIATVHYFANGSAKFPKERVEIFVDGAVLQIDNFKKLRGFGWRGFSNSGLWQQDKGQSASAVAFLRSIETGVPAIPPHEIFEVAERTIEAANLIASS